MTALLTMCGFVDGWVRVMI